MKHMNQKKLKLISIVATRPQFIKSAVISNVIKQNFSKAIEEKIIHTGQHYDHSMSINFFRYFQMEKPVWNLRVGSAGHGKQTAKMLSGIESILLREKPDMTIVYGDCNSTLAGALAASKLNIPVCHIESGIRSYNKNMPEEINRVVTDHLSSYLYCPTENAVRNLSREGIENHVYSFGDITYDSFLTHSEQLDSEITVKTLIPKDVGEKEFFLMTLHRAENCDDLTRLESIVIALNDFKDCLCILPAHPRLQKALKISGLKLEDHILKTEPVGYLQMLALEKQAQFIVTDSGGVQKEAYFFKKPCITLRDETEWPETVSSGWNRLIGISPEEIRAALRDIKYPVSHPSFFGDGNAGKKIVGHLLSQI